MKSKLFMILFISVLLPAQAQMGTVKQMKNAALQAPPEIRIPLRPEYWDFQEGKVKFTEYKGIEAVIMDENSGYMVYKDLYFENGIIEADVEVNQPQPFPAIYFRWESDRETEHVYLRTGTPEKPDALDAVQYASIINGVNIWDLQHEFQSSANIRINEWNHIKLVISRRQLRVYVNGEKEPNLEIPCLEGNTSGGKICIGTGFPGQAVFANLVVRPDVTEGLPDGAAPDITKHDTRYIRDWQVSTPGPLPPGMEINADRLPGPQMSWEPINAERRGLVNLSRKFGNSTERRYVWLRAGIISESIQTQLIKLGFSDEVWVFLNRKPVYVDKNIYLLGMRKSPNGRISLDNASFAIQFQKGENELLIGIANDFYGWGVMARLEGLDGITIVK